MNVILQFVVMLGLVACGAAGGIATAGDLADLYTNDPYKGKASAQVFEPAGPGDPKKDSGTGSAQFIATGKGKSRLVVKANIREAGDAGFVMEGAQSASGWSGRTGDLRLVIDSNGNIRGGGVANQHRITFGGHATAESFDLTVETEKLAQAGQACCQSAPGSCSTTTSNAHPASRARVSRRQQRPTRSRRHASEGSGRCATSPLPVAG